MTGNSTHENPPRCRNNINTKNNNNNKNLVQPNIHGESVSTTDSEELGDAFSIIPGSNVSLIALCVLSLWRAGSPLKLSDFPRLYGIRDAMRDQETLWWTKFLLGRWRPTWQLTQSKHYRRISIKESPRWWAAAIIACLFLVAWDVMQQVHDRLHAKAGSKTLSRHPRFDTRTEEEMTAEFAESPRCLILFRNTLLLQNMVTSLEGIMS